MSVWEQSVLDLKLAYPAEVLSTLSTSHLIAASKLLDRELAPRARFRVFIDEYFIENVVSSRSVMLRFRVNFRFLRDLEFIRWTIFERVEGPVTPRTKLKHADCALTKEVLLVYFSRFATFFKRAPAFTLVKINLFCQFYLSHSIEEFMAETYFS